MLFSFVKSKNEFMFSLIFWLTFLSSVFIFFLRLSKSSRVLFSKDCRYSKLFSIVRSLATSKISCVVSQFLSSFIFSFENSIKRFLNCSFSPIFCNKLFTACFNNKSVSIKTSKLGFNSKSKANSRISLWLKPSIVVMVSEA